MFNVYELRKDFPKLNDLVYLNTGTVGISPLPVVKELLKSIEYFEVNGQVGWGASEQKMGESRHRLATFLDVSADELTFTRNATDGIDLVTNGIDWKESDEVIVSDQEHPAMLYPWYYLQQQRKVTIRRFHVSKDPNQTLDSIKSLLNRRTRLLGSSHVTSQSGIRVPVKEICELCGQKEVLALLDGAQAVGQFKVSPKEIGCDFYTGNIHKWLLGPKGTGFLYISKDKLDQLQPTWVGAGSAKEFNEQSGLKFHDSARKFEFATRDFGKYAAVSAVFDWFESKSLGWSNVEAHLRYLSDYLKSNLQNLPKAILHTPPKWELSSALTTFSIQGISHQEVMKQLWEKGQMLTRGVGEFDATRISTAVFNTKEEIDQLIALLEKM